MVKNSSLKRSSTFKLIGDIILQLRDSFNFLGEGDIFGGFEFLLNSYTWHFFRPLIVFWFYFGPMRHFFYKENWIGIYAIVIFSIAINLPGSWIFFRHFFESFCGRFLSIFYNLNFPSNYILDINSYFSVKSAQIEPKGNQWLGKVERLWKLKTG